MSNLILFGLAASGKTYWGKRLAKALQLTFIDTDALLESLFLDQYSKKCTCSEIYKEKGEETFRDLEHRVIRSLVKKTNCIIALGGGAVLDAENLKILHQIGTMIYLKEEKAVLKKRLLAGPVRAFFSSVDPIRDFDLYYKRRLPVYENIPSQVLFLSELNEEKIINRCKEIFYGL
ncbi:MAG: AAA family ATPase [Parachlamydiales bacterium]|nr:AAA family ATPase [Parachlamydiales bacterium]